MKQDTVLTRLVIGLIFVVVAAYMSLSAIKTFTNPHRMVVVYSNVVENSLAVDGWFFRDEVSLDPAYGLINYNLNEGEKASGGQAVAVSYQSKEALDRQQNMRTLEIQLAQLNYAISDEALSGKNLETELIAATTKIQSTAANGNLGQITQQADQYKRLALRREYLYSDSGASELGLASIALGQELANLGGRTGETATVIYAPQDQAGVFSSYVDGYETLLDPALLDGISAQEFRELIAQTPLPENGSAGKLATSSTWYMAMVIGEDALPLFKEYSQVSVRFSSLAQAVPMSVNYVGYAMEGEAVVVLSSRRNLAETISLREQAASVIFRSDQGVQIPQNALREREGVLGVYTVTGYRAEFKPVTVVAEDRDYYIVTPNPKNAEDKRILRSGDEVIITSAELYEGKVVR